MVWVAEGWVEVTWVVVSVRSWAELDGLDWLGRGWVGRGDWVGRMGWGREG